MATEFTATYRIYTNDTQTQARNVTINRTIARLSPDTLDTSGVVVASATINMTGTDFPSASSNNPYLDLGNIGRVSVPYGASKSAIAITVPDSTFSLNNLLSIGTSGSTLAITAHKTSSGNVIDYNACYLTITANCVRTSTKSTATVTQSVVAGEDSTVTLTNSDFTTVTHSLTWTFGSNTHTETLSLGTTSKSYTIPLAWLNTIPNAVSGTATVRVTTYGLDGTSLGYDDYSFTVKVPDAGAPSITLTTERIDNDVPSSWGIYVQNQSGVEITASFTGYYGSTAESYLLSGDAVISQQSNVFEIDPVSKSGSLSYTVKVTDTRGRTATATTSISVTSYTLPTLVLTDAFRCDSSGTSSEEGTYLSVKANGTYDTVGGNNAITVTARYGLVTSETYGNPVTLTNNAASVIGDGRIVTGSSYRVKFQFSDQFTTLEKIVYVGTENYTMFFKSGGNGVAFGKTAERSDAIEINPDWDIYHGNTKLNGTVPVDRGGTGETTVQAFRNDMGLGNTLSSLPVANGGTGADNAEDARDNLEITPANIGAAATSHSHAASDITSGTLSASMLPFLILGGVATLSDSSWTTVSFGATLPNIPIVVASYSVDTSSNVLKTRNATTTGFEICVAGSGITGTRYANWIAICANS